MSPNAPRKSAWIPIESETSTRGGLIIWHEKHFTQKTSRFRLRVIITLVAKWCLLYFTDRSLAQNLIESVYIGKNVSGSPALVDQGEGAAAVPADGRTDALSLVGRWRRTARARLQERVPQCVRLLGISSSQRWRKDASHSKQHSLLAYLFKKHVFF